MRRSDWLRGGPRCWCGTEAMSREDANDFIAKVKCWSPRCGNEHGTRLTRNPMFELFMSLGGCEKHVKHWRSRGETRLGRPILELIESV